MSEKEAPRHAVRIRWRSFEVEIIGWPAVVSFWATTAVLVSGQPVNLLNYFLRLP